MANVSPVSTAAHRRLILLTLDRTKLLEIKDKETAVIRGFESLNKNSRA